VSAGDQQGNIRVWDLTAGACSCELVPEVGTPVRSLTVAQDASMVIAANNAGQSFSHLSHWVRWERRPDRQVVGTSGGLGPIHSRAGSLDVSRSECFLTQDGR